MNTTTTNPAEHEVFEIIDGVSNLLMDARRLKAITQAFSDAFTDCATGADVEAIKARPEHFCYLFSALELCVCAVEEQAAGIDAAGGDYLRMKRAQQQTA